MMSRTSLRGVVPLIVTSLVLAGMAVALPASGALSPTGASNGSSASVALASSVCGSASGGYYQVAADGGVFTFGGARYFGSMAGKHLSAPIVAIIPTANDGGYWLVGADGGVFSFGDAKFAGSMSGRHLSKPIVGGAAPASAGCPGPEGVRGPQGVAGNTILSGTTAPPASTLGNVGDFYLDTNSDVLYGPKTSSGWQSTGTSLIGPAGTNGINGTNGNTVLNGTTAPPASTLGNVGDFYLDTNSDVLYGPKSASGWPSTGTSLIGSQGVPGSAAPDGQVFSTGGASNPYTYTVPPGVSELNIQIWGGGGAGGNSNGGAGAGGGGAGGYLRALVPVGGDASCQVVVGSGGIADSIGAVLGSGTSSTFTCGVESVQARGGVVGLASGGGSGNFVAVTSGVIPLGSTLGGSGSAGSNSSGGDGGGYYYFTNTDGGAFGGPGGNGTDVGSGGGGGGPGSQSGGNGASGLVIVTPVIS